MTNLTIPTIPIISMKNPQSLFNSKCHLETFKLDREKARDGLTCEHLIWYYLKLHRYDTVAYIIKKSFPTIEFLNECMSDTHNHIFRFGLDKLYSFTSLFFNEIFDYINIRRITFKPILNSVRYILKYLYDKDNADYIKEVSYFINRSIRDYHYRHIINIFKIITFGFKIKYDANYFQPNTSESISVIKDFIKLNKENHIINLNNDYVVHFLITCDDACDDSEINNTIINEIKSISSVCIDDFFNISTRYINMPNNHQLLASYKICQFLCELVSKFNVIPARQTFFDFFTSIKNKLADKYEIFKCADEILKIYVKLNHIHFQTTQSTLSNDDIDQSIKLYIYCDRHNDCISYKNKQQYYYSVVRKLHHLTNTLPKIFIQSIKKIFLLVMYCDDLISLNDYFNISSEFGKIFEDSDVSVNNFQIEGRHISIDKLKYFLINNQTYTPECAISQLLMSFNSAKINCDVFKDILECINLKFKNINTDIFNKIDNDGNTITHFFIYNIIRSCEFTSEKNKDIIKIPEHESDRAKFFKLEIILKIQPNITILNKRNHSVFQMLCKYRFFIKLICDLYGMNAFDWNCHYQEDYFTKEKLSPLYYLKKPVIYNTVRHCHNAIPCYLLSDNTFMSTRLH